MKANLLNLLCLTSVASAAFPYYDTIHLGLSALYVYSQPNAPFAVVFWGSFVESLDSTLDKAIAVCKTCEAKHEEPNWDCVKASKGLTVSVVKNAISLYVGLQHAGTPNGSLEGQDTSALKKRSLGGIVWQMKVMITVVLVLGYLIIIEKAWLPDGMKYLTHLLKEISNFQIYT